MNSKLIVLHFLSWWIQRHIRCLVERPFPNPPFIVAANHTSYFDHFLLSWLLLSRGLPSPKFITKKELFDSPVSAMFNRANGGIPIDREGVDTEAFDLAGSVLVSGGIVVVYPEGTRSRTGHIGLPKAGISLLASRHQVPVVPFGLLGVQHVLPVGKKMPTRGRKAFIHMGIPLDPPGDSRQQQKEFSLELMRQIALLSGQWSPIYGELTGDRLARMQSLLQADIPSEPIPSELEQALTINEQAFHAPVEEAIAGFEQTVQLLNNRKMRNDPLALVELGRAYAKLADYAKSAPRKIHLAMKAKKAMQTGLQARPNNAIGWHAWGMLIERLPHILGGNAALGIHAHRMAAALRPDWRRGSLALANAHYRRGQHKEALLWARTVLATHPSFPRDDIRAIQAEEIIEAIEALTGKEKVEIAATNDNVAEQTRKTNS